MFEKIKNMLKQKESTKNKNTNIVCPICAHELLEHKDAYICSGTLSGDCSFKMQHTFKGIKITPDVINGIRFLKEYEETFSELDKLCYFTKLNKKRIIDTEFKYSEPRYLECPSCKEFVYRNNNLICCSNDNCDFVLSASFMGAIFSDEQIVELFNKRISNEYEFYDSNASKKVKGRVLLKLNNNYKTKNLEYLFVKDINTLDKEYLNYYFLPKSLSKRYEPIKTLIKK